MLEWSGIVIDEGMEEVHIFIDVIVVFVHVTAFVMFNLAYFNTYKMVVSLVKGNPHSKNIFHADLTRATGGHGGRVVTLSPPTSEAGVRSASRPQVGKLVVACRWSAVCSTEP